MSGLARATDGAHTLAGDCGLAYDLMMINRSHVESSVGAGSGSALRRVVSAVVLLMVRTGARGFWHAEGRLCVALTRARHHMTVIASDEWALG